MVSLNKYDNFEAVELPSCTPEHLLTEEQASTAVQTPQMLPVTAPKNTPLAKSPAGVLTQISQKERAQERLNTFLRQSEVFALRQNLCFKYDKKDVLIERGARIKIHCAELSGDGKKIKLNLCSVTKDDWDNADIFFGNHKFSYANLWFNIDALEKYFQPDSEVTRLMKCAGAFKYLFGASAFVLATLGLLISIWCMFGRSAEHAPMFAVLIPICSIAAGLSTLFGTLIIRTRNMIYGELRDVENQILQRALTQQEDEDGNELPQRRT